MSNRKSLGMGVAKGVICIASCRVVAHSRCIHVILIDMTMGEIRLFAAYLLLSI